MKGQPPVKVRKIFHWIDYYLKPKNEKYNYEEIVLRIHISRRDSKNIIWYWYDGNGGPKGLPHDHPENKVEIDTNRLSTDIENFILHCCPPCCPHTSYEN
jgi:hypothetical protein